MGSKTEILGFDAWYKEAKKLNDDGFSAKDFFEAGQQSKQPEVDELKKKYDAMYNAFVVADDCRKEWHRCYVGIRQSEDKLQKRVKELELINFDSELHFDAAKEHIDHLQKKIDDAINCLEKNKPSLKINYKHAISALSILKGEETK